MCCKNAKLDFSMHEKLVCRMWTIGHFTTSAFRNNFLWKIILFEFCDLVNAMPWTLWYRIKKTFWFLNYIGYLLSVQICVNVPKMPTSGMRIWSILRIRWVKFLYFFIFSSILRSAIYLKASKSVRRSICRSQSQPSQRSSKLVLTETLKGKLIDVLMHSDVQCLWWASVHSVSF